MTQTTPISFVSTESSFDVVRRKNFYIYGFISSFVWMCFHFTLVYFFGLRLESALLVGLFLGLGNLVAFLVDSPIGVLQKYFDAKKLFLASTGAMFVVSVICMYFVFSSKIESTVTSSLPTPEILANFLTSGVNLLLLLLSVVLYGVIKELSDVTSLSYIMNNADPSEYAELLSKNNIFSGLGALVGLIVSGVVLSLSIVVAVVILIVFIGLFTAFIVVYFDNSRLTISLNIADIKKLKIISPMETIESVKQYTISQIQKTDFTRVAEGMKFIFLKPLQIRKMINFREMFEIGKDDLRSFYEVLIFAPRNYKLLILSIIVILFGFWDTFVVTFLISFLDKILDSNRGDNILIQMQLFTGYIFIAILSIPAFGAQLPFIQLSKRLGAFPIIFFGVAISGVSVFLFGLSNGFMLVLILGLINSLGYAAAMPIAQGEFSDAYNQVYAEKRKLTEIDSNASAAPLKMILNLANVVGLVLGWILIGMFGFNGTFFVLGGILMVVFVVAILKKVEWKL